MAGNSKRRGATRNANSKKGASVGTGGHGRKALEGKGPTPKATDRPYHKAYKAKERSAAAAAKTPAPAKRGPRDRTSGSHELVVGRNSVLEALRNGMRATLLHVFDRIDADDRITEIVSLAVGLGITVRDATKGQLDKLSDGAVHQGVALEVPPYTYVEPEDLLEAASPVRIVVLDHIQD